MNKIRDTNKGSALKDGHYQYIRNVNGTFQVQAFYFGGGSTSPSKSAKFVAKNIARNNTKSIIPLLIELGWIDVIVHIQHIAKRNFATKRKG